jgi:hypothetical protein
MGEEKPDEGLMKKSRIILHTVNRHPGMPISIALPPQEMLYRSGKNIFGKMDTDMVR